MTTPATSQTVQGFLELFSPVAINASPHRHRLAEAGIKGGWNYALDHAWLFEQIETYLQRRRLPLAVILDVGCGNSMFHPFLEKELGMGIVGIDRIEGLCPHPGRTNIMDFCSDLRQLRPVFAGMADIVFWLSSIEHNPPEIIRDCMETSLELLKPGGLFLATFGYAPATHFYQPSECTNLSAEDAASLFGVAWKAEPDFEKTVAEYRLDLMELDARHRKRYGTDEYAFVAAGVALRKP